MKLYMIDEGQLAVLRKLATQFHTENWMSGDEMRDAGHALESIARTCSELEIQDGTLAVEPGTRGAAGAGGEMEIIGGDDTRGLLSSGAGGEVRMETPGMQSSVGSGGKVNPPEPEVCTAHIGPFYCSLLKGHSGGHRHDHHDAAGNVTSVNWPSAQ